MHRGDDQGLSEREFIAMGDAIADLATQIDVATHRLLSKIREFDTRGGWCTAGCLSCAHWLSWRIGMSLGVAREKVRVAHRLAELPQIDQAFANGHLSYSKVRAMTRVATADNEHQLLILAANSTAAQLEKMCRLYRGIKRLEGQADQVETYDRYLECRDTDDGMVSITLKVLPDEAARFMKAAEACAGGQRLVDGAVHLAEMALHNDTGAARGPTSEDRSVRSPNETVIHISAEDLGGHTEDGDGIPAETARRLLCDSGIVPMLEDQRGKALDVGRKTRVVSAGLRRALDHRDGGCQFPGCTNTRFVDAHHIEHWVYGGATELGNLVQLCRRHHRYVHEWGYSIERHNDSWVFVRPDGMRVSAAPPRPIVEQPRAPQVTDNNDAGRSILGAHGWDGMPLDYEACVHSLCS